MSELKPCPFCGGKAKLHIDCFHTWSVFCTNIKTCNAKTLTFKHRSSASNEWNSRYDDAAITEHNRLLQLENEQLAKDKAELVDLLDELNEWFKSEFIFCGDGNLDIEKILEKHKCD